MAIARFPSFVIDCPDAAALAGFYGELLGWPANLDDDWAEIRDSSTGQCICFQQVAEFRPPEWPGQQVPQQMHLDVVVDELETAEAAAVAIGARRVEYQPGTTFRVLLDPAGHPFCLCID